MRTCKMARLCLAVAVLAGCAAAAQPQADIIVADQFSTSDNWDYLFPEGDPQAGTPRLSVQVRDNAMELGTCGTGATLKAEVPRDVLLQTQAKVAILPPYGIADTSLRGVNIYLRKTEENGAWHAYVVRLWCKSAPDSNDGYVLVREMRHQEGRYVDLPLAEKHYDLRIDTWYDVRVSLIDNQITVWIDGEEVLTVTDPQRRCPAGRVALAGAGWPSYAAFRDFQIRRSE